jgi:PST family polysaccharide transporter
MKLPAAPSPSAPPLPPPGGTRGIAAAQLLRIVARIAGAMALARLLVPADYGIFSMAVATFGVLHIARDLGLVTALQDPQFAAADFPAACRAGLLGGLALMLAGFALAYPTGWFFHELRLVPAVLAGLSLSLFFSALAAPAIGLLYRAQQSACVARIEASAIALGTLGGIAAAAAGAGVWAIVVMTLLGEIIVCVWVWRLSPLAFACRASNRAALASASLGAAFAGHNLATYLCRMADQIVVGRVQGVVALGLYARGAQIAAIPAQYGIGPFTGHFVAALARCHDAPAEFVRCFRHGMNGLFHVSCAAAGLCIAVPDLLLLGLFGPQWTEAVPVVRWTGFVLAVQPLLGAPFWVLSSRAEKRALLAWAGTGVVLIGGGCAAAAPHGLAAVAQATAAATVLHAALVLPFCAGRTPLRISDWLQPLALPAALHGTFAALVATLDRVVGSAAPELLRAALLGAVAALYYGAIALVSSRFRAEIRGHLFWSR